MDFQEVVFAGGHQGVDHRGEFLGPLGAGGEDYRAGAGDFPLAGVVGGLTVAMAAPAVVHHFKAEGGAAIEVGFEGERLFLLAPAAQDPLYRQGTGAKIQGQAGILEPAGRQLKAGVQAGASGRTAFDDFAAAAAGDLYPTQGGRAFAPVVTREGVVPNAQETMAPNASISNRRPTEDLVY